MISNTILGTTIIGILLSVNPLQAESPTGNLPDITPEQRVQIVFGDKADIMLAIAECESGQEQFDSDGTTKNSPTNDWGFMQINATSWDKEAKRLGLDYKGSVKDNIEMAKYIYNKQGLRAWSTYKNGCYKKHL
jgi:hypothetical protein